MALAKPFALFVSIMMIVAVSLPAVSDEIYARKRPAFIDIGWNKLADHTYGVAKDSKGNIRTYSNAGSDSGGDKMSNTVGNGDRKYMSCVNSKRSNECNVVFGVNGVCHQSTNLMLKKTSPLLSTGSVNGYSYSKGKWGEFGVPKAYVANSLGSICRSACSLD